MSNDVESRSIAPRPPPAVPPVEKPSRIAAPMSGIPGPLSSATSSSVAGAPSSANVPRTCSSPPAPWRTMLVAASLATIATCPPCVSSNPSSRASAAACRRASPTWLGSVSGKTVTTLCVVIGGARSLPAGDGDARPLAHLRHDVELVHQAPGAAEPQPQAVAGREAVGEGALHVGDPRAVVLEDEPQPAASVLFDRQQPHGAAEAVVERVARQLARRGDELGLVHQPEAQLGRPRADRLSDLDDVGRRPDGHHLIPGDGHRPEPRHHPPPPPRSRRRPRRASSGPRGRRRAAAPSPSPRSTPSARRGARARARPA